MKMQLLLIAAMFHLAVSAQETAESLLNGDKCWTMRNKLVVSPDLGDQYRFTELTLKEDTLIDGIRFRKIMKRSRRQDEAEFGEWLYGHSALGQQGDKVYLYSDTYKCPRLIMDFSADYLSTVPVGVFSGEETDFLITSAADTMYVTPDGTFTRRCLHAQSVAVPAFTDVWVSGVGSLIYGIESNIGASGAVPQLWKVVSDGMIIYQREQETVGIENTSNTANTATTVYDLQGRRVTGQLRRGVYIQDGRKQVR